MKVALIGDVHANLPALEAVLADARQRKVEAIWNLGDFVGYGAFPNEVVSRLREEDVLSIVGNYDLKVLKFKEKDKRWRKKKHPYKYLSFRWAYESLSKKNRKYLRFLSQEIRVKVAGRRILLTHGSPLSNEEHLTPDTPRKRLRELGRTANADVVICGHSHQPFAHKAGSVWFINTGSVGRPDDGDPRACYAIMWISSKRLRTQHFRIKYDLQRAVDAVRERGLPEVFAQMIIQGRSLDEVVGAEDV